MTTLDDHIAQSLLESQRNGELASARHWGKPLDLDDGYAHTPPELRMAFKALKDGGFVPPEVETMKRIAALRERIASSCDAAEIDAMRRRLAEMQQHLALRLERLRVSGTL